MVKNIINNIMKQKQQNHIQNNHEINIQDQYHKIGDI